VTVRAVLLDFYGTLARATQWVSADDVLAEHGYTLAEASRSSWYQADLDGVEHVEHSQSRDHYRAWQRERILGMLAQSDVHPGEHEVILEKLRGGTESRVLEAYPEVPAALRSLRDRGLALVVCSNWDWDLAEAVAEAGLTDLVDEIVSSAWAGARKPHPRIFRHTFEQVDVAPEACLFVGDTWGPDVEGPRAVGMRPVYLVREGHWPDPGAPDDPHDSRYDGVTVATDLAGVLDVVTEVDTAGPGERQRDGRPRGTPRASR